MEPASGCGAPDCGPAWQDLGLLAVIMTPCDAQLGLLGLVDGVLLHSGSPLGRRQSPAPDGRAHSAEEGGWAEARGSEMPSLVMGCVLAPCWEPAVVGDSAVGTPLVVGWVGEREGLRSSGA